MFLPHGILGSVLPHLRGRRPRAAVGRAEGAAAGEVSAATEAAREDVPPVEAAR
jgi:hypothetical protein